MNNTNSHIATDAAFLAPLTPSFIEHSFSRHMEKEIKSIPRRLSPMEARQWFEHIRENYFHDIRAARQMLMETIDPLIVQDAGIDAPQGKLNLNLVAELLAQPGPSGERVALSANSIATYAKKGLLLKGRHGAYNPVRVLALAMLRAVDPGERNWAPLEAVPVHEEGWYCWSQEGPGAPVQPCPYPNIPINMPAETLLFTRFACASWDNQAWFRIGYQGAITFAGLIWNQRYQTASIGLEELAVWDPGLRRRASSEQQKTIRQEDAVDASLGLSIVLPFLIRYHYDGLLMADVAHLPREVGRSGQCSIQVQDGQVRSCSLMDYRGQQHSVAIDLLKSSENRWGPFAWRFHPQKTLPADRMEIDRLTLKVLNDLATGIFSPANINRI